MWQGKSPKKETNCHGKQQWQKHHEMWKRAQKKKE